MIFHFTRTSNGDMRGESEPAPTDDADGPNTRSNDDELEDWMVDMSAVDITTTDVRRLSFYPIEQLLFCKERARLLMLVKQSLAESKLGKGVAETVSVIQGTEPILISGEYYHRLQCEIIDATHHWDARGEGLGVSLKQFESDFTHRRCGFGVQFVGSETKLHFNWQDIVDDGCLLKYFGPLLLFTCSFDTVFHRVNNKSTFCHRFKCFYDEFQEDVVSCLAIYNAYINRRLTSTEEKLATAQAKTKMFN